MTRARVLAVVAGALATAVLAAPAAAFTAPELFVRMQPWDTHEPASDWIPLAAAPALDYLGGYEIGYRLQASGEPNEFQRVALTVAGVPDGVPTQPLAAPPYCVGRAGTVGTIVAAGPELQFEGTGTYTVTVSVGPGAGGAVRLPGGAVDHRVVRRRRARRAALAGDAAELPRHRAPGQPVRRRPGAAPPGGAGRHPLRAGRHGPAGRLGRRRDRRAGLRVSSLPPCPSSSSRARASGRASPAAPPRAGTTSSTRPSSARPGRAADVEVRSDFRRRIGMIKRPRAKRPRFTFVAEWPDAARAAAPP